MDRRQFTSKAFRTAVTVLFVESLFGCTGKNESVLSETNNIIEPKAVAALNHWAVDLNRYCGDLRAGTLTVVEWQEKLSELFERIELSDLLKFIDFEKLIEGFKLPDLGVATKKIVFPAVEGIPADTVFVRKLFGMKPGRAIIPHGHSNMSSGHLVLKGNLKLRQYDKVRIEKDSMIVRGTVDKVVGSGDFSSISDDRNNVHWFINGGEAAYTFDVIMLDLAGRKYDIHNLDMDAAKKDDSGEMRVPILAVDDALARYGKSHDA